MVSSMILSSELALAEFMQSLTLNPPWDEAPTRSKDAEHRARYDADTDQLLTYLRTRPADLPIVASVKRAPVPSSFEFSERQMQIAMAVFDMKKRAGKR